MLTIPFVKSTSSSSVHGVYYMPKEDATAMWSFGSPAETVTSNVSISYLQILVFIILLCGMTIFALKQHQQKKKLAALNVLMALQKGEIEETVNELSTKEQEMRHLVQVQSRILSIIGHDLRGPLGSIYEVFRLYANGDMKMEEGEFFPVMKECAKQMGAVYFLAENLLFWAKNQNHEVRTHPGNYNLNRMVNETLDLLEQFATAKGIKLRTEIESDFYVNCDYNQIGTVLRNLVSNAIKFTSGNGNVIISCKRIKEEVLITVTDTGIGMDQEQLNLLINRETTFSTRGTDNEPGTGLGISLISEFVENNGGKLIGTSYPGKGTSLSFSLPHTVKDHKVA